MATRAETKPPEERARVKLPPEPGTWLEHDGTLAQFIGLTESGLYKLEDAKRFSENERGHRIYDTSLVEAAEMALWRVVTPASDSEVAIALMESEAEHG